MRAMRSASVGSMGRMRLGLAFEGCATAASRMTAARPRSYHARLFAHRRNVSPRPAVPMPEIPTVAYFCMEFGLHESFPIYAGGLGVLAGDFIKSACDLGLPMVAVSL